MLLILNTFFFTFMSFLPLVDDKINTKTWVRLSLLILVPVIIHDRFVRRYFLLSWQISLPLTFAPQSAQTQPVFAWPVWALQTGRRLQRAEPAPQLCGESHRCDTLTGSPPAAPHYRINTAGNTWSQTAQWTWVFMSNFLQPHPDSCNNAS